jgi:2-C-methyl-D-erythritol 4-phosphate cytidylyltransferase
MIPFSPKAVLTLKERRRIMKVYALIPSGGIGSRTKGAIPKQYLKFNGRELISYTLDVFQQSELIDEIIIAAQSHYFPLLKKISEQYSFTKITQIVEGGKERQHSVMKALKSINASENDLIAVHDAVRPLLPQSVLNKTLEAAAASGAAIAALKAQDTLIKGTDIIRSYTDRNEYYYVQTPQVFRYGILAGAMRQAETEGFIGTDESMLVHRAGFDIKIIDGSSFNFKITNKDDVRLFELICRSV